MNTDNIIIRIVFRLWNWAIARVLSAFNTLVDNAIVATFIAVLALLCFVVGLRSNRPPVSELAVNSMDGIPGYTFVTGVFSTAETELAGSGSIQFRPAQIERIRVCRDLKIPQHDDVAEVLATLEAKLSPCLSITPSRIEAEGVRYVVTPTDAEDLREVKRADRGKTEPVTQFFCFCDERVIEKFMKDAGGTKWP